MGLKLLFVGSHLSKIRGTKGIAEKIPERLGDKYSIKLTSSIENKYLRIIDIAYSSIFSKYDIMHIDVYSGPALIYAKIASIIAKVKKKKVLMNLRGGRLSEYNQQHPNVLEKLFSRADIILSPSKFLTQFFNEKNIEVRYLPNFIDQNNFLYSRDNVKPYSLLWVRAFNDIYQPELAVNTLYDLTKKYPDIRLTMIGPDKGRLEETQVLIKKLGLEDKIDILGKIPNEELYKYYQTHSVYLNTTKYESFGAAVLEAASCGIPIVSTNVGEMPYLWNENKEISLCSANHNEMSKKVDELLELDEMQRMFSLNARKKSEQYDWKIIEKQWNEVFDEGKKYD